MIDQGEMFDIDSPCLRVCKTNAKGYCIGCWRNRKERFYWHQLTTHQKQQIINLSHKRRLRVMAAMAEAELPPPPPEPPSPQTDMFANTTPDEAIAEAEQQLNLQETIIDRPTPPSNSAPSNTELPKVQKPPRKRTGPSNEEQLGLF